MPDGFDKSAPVPLAILIFALVVLDVRPRRFDPFFAPRAAVAPSKLLPRSPFFGQLMRFLETLACQKRVAIPAVVKAFFELGDEVAVLPALIQKEHLHGLFLSVTGVRASQH
jgi:hypothetical protein